MKILFKISLLVFVLVQLAIKSNIAVVELIYILVIIASNIFRYKYFNIKWMIALEALVIFAALQHNPSFALLYGIVAFDIIELGYFVGVIPIILIGYLRLSLAELPSYLLLIFLSCLFSYVSHGLTEKEKTLKQSFDKERIARYELEQTRVKLLNSAKEITHLTEIKERNRIAREIHDNIGHKVAGILLQLQAAEKLYNKDGEKALKLLRNSIEGLTDSLVHLRETVHNIKPKDNLGIEYIEGITNQFQYCPVKLIHSGDINSISPSHMEILASNIKEALTNISKHSNATVVEISIETNEAYTRLFIKDNGVGCSRIKENMGLGGMRDRIKNIGGSISINGDDGFLIVCMLYK